MANLIYQLPQTAKVWKSSGGDAVWTPTSLGSGAGRQGAHLDFGSTARSRLYAWICSIVPGATRVVGQIGLRIYWKAGDGTYYENDDGTGDAAVSSINKLRNLRVLGAITIDEDAAVPMTASGLIELPHRYGAPVGWNGSSNALSSTATDFFFALYPVPDEIQ